jgi:hypothetical protein
MSKKSLFMYLFSAVIFSVISCEEEPPYINYEPTKVTYETTYVDVNIPQPQLRQVVLEDISGVRCVNCPDAALIIENIKSTYPGRVNSVTIHPNTPSLDVFTRPITKAGHESQQDFRTQPGGDILSKLGIPGSLPSGYVNRKLFPGKQYRYTDRTEWTSLCISEMDSITKVHIVASGLVSGNDGVVDITLTFLDNLGGDYFVSIMLLEDSIIDVQESQNGATIEYINDYEHKYILRNMFTNVSGDKLNNTTIGGIAITSLERGRVIKKRFTLPLNSIWQRNKLQALVFIHRGSDEVIIHSRKTVLIP